TKSATCTNASPPNARTPPATKKRTPPIIESWECPYVISKKNGNIAPPCRLFQCFRIIASLPCKRILGLCRKIEAKFILLKIRNTTSPNYRFGTQIGN
ncbi:MAG: hypothetical protein MSA44_06735, partial [Bacteroidales bacterium]|nr:hypothetical protein [Bacteroidales bacterium]